MLSRAYRGEEKPIKRILPELFKEIPYSEICALLRRKDVKVDGKRVSDGNFLVSAGSEIIIYPRIKKSVVVVYEDERILVCNKPKGIPTTGDDSYETLVKAEKGDSLVVMHRLDTNTDGLLLFAKDKVAEEEIFKAIKDGKIEKGYIAEVYGHPRVQGETTLHFFYKKNEEEKRGVISKEARAGFLPVEITIRVLREKEETSVLRVTLHKGKMHQIRAMLAAYGYFIVGDGKYGNDQINKCLGFKKHLLTATELIFHFPDSSPLFYLNNKKISL